MKNLGILILLVGLSLGGYSLSMDVSVGVPARNFGYGVATPAMQVVNIDKMAQRQNFMVFSGILSVVGAILLGFGAMQPSRTRVGPPDAPRAPTSPDEDREWMDNLLAAPKTVSICPKCGHLGAGDDTSCGQCGIQMRG
jgi:hypothetical protein